MLMVAGGRVTSGPGDELDSVEILGTGKFLLNHAGPTKVKVTHLMF